MASATAVTTDPTRNLWQLPTFILGIAALFGVWYASPYLRPSSDQLFERYLHQLRQASEKSPLDTALLRESLEKPPKNDPPPTIANRFHFLTGSAQVLLAESIPNDPDVDQFWKAARGHLEKVAPEGLPESDRGRLQFRLAKANARSADIDPRKAILALSTSLQSGDDPSEGHRILAELYLKVQPPEPRKARDSLRDYLRYVPSRTDARMVNQARLRLGELHTQLNEPDEAKKVIERIGPDAPSDIYIAARSHLAKGYEAEEDWPQALRHWEQARNAPNITSEQQDKVAYHLGNTLQHLKRTNDAIVAYERALKGTGAESRAAGIKLAEMRLSDPTGPKMEAVDALETALRGINTAADYQNPLITLVETRSVCISMVEKYRQMKWFEPALRVAKLMGRIGEPGQDKELCADIAEAWGEEGMILARASVDERDKLEAEAKSHYREAANACAAAADLKKKSVDKGDMLKRASALYLKAGDRTEARRVMDLLSLKVPDYPEDKSGKAWLDNGEVYLSEGNKPQAILAFQNAISRPGPAQTRGRLRIAQLLLESNDANSLNKALSYLEQNLDDPEAAKKDREAHERTLFTLGEVLYQQKEWNKAEFRLRSAIDTYPESPLVLKARFQYGHCFRNQAQQLARQIETDRDISNRTKDPNERAKAETRLQTNETRYLELLKKALEPFRQVEEILEKSPSDDPELFRRAAFQAADCALWLGEYDDSAARYARLAQRYQGHIEELEALRYLWLSHHYARRGDEARQTIQRMKVAITTIPDLEFDDKMDVRRKRYWEALIRQIEAQGNS